MASSKPVLLLSHFCMSDANKCTTVAAPREYSLNSVNTIWSASLTTKLFFSNNPYTILCMMLMCCKLVTSIVLHPRLKYLSKSFAISSLHNISLLTMMISVEASSSSLMIQVQVFKLVKLLRTISFFSL